MTGVFGRNPEARRRAYRRGLSAETVVAWVLRLRGFSVIARRYRTALGESDLVARRGRLVIFVEVKARAAPEHGTEAVTIAARRRIVAAANQFIARHPGLSGHDRRFDIALVAPRRLPRFVENAFDADT
jgi:putative endonuclease